MPGLDAMPKAKTPRQPLVSDHAVLRYLERAVGIDIEAVRKSMLTPKVVAAIECGASRVYLPGENITLVISETGAIKTVLEHKRSRPGVR